MARPRSWTDAELRAAVASSGRLIDVLRALGLSVGGATLDAVRNRILQLGLDCSHMERPVRSAKWQTDPGDSRRGVDRRTWTDEDLRAAVAEATSIAGVIRALDLTIGGSMYLRIREAIEALDLDTSHFTGQAWLRDRSNPYTRRRPLREVLVEGSTYYKTHHLKLRLVREGLKRWQCERCQRTRWNGQRIPLQLDHINGDRTDNRLENLRLLCPNCHAQTETWCGRNRGRYG
jgi:hypothetical protein